MLQVQFYREGVLFTERLMHHCPRAGDLVTVDTCHKLKIESIDWQTQAPDPYHDRDVVHIHLEPMPAG